jgi:hypothetical protein
MKPQLSVEGVYDDGDLIEVRVAASNESFAGAVCVYITAGDLDQAAAQLRGFPLGASDQRRITWGTPDGDLGFAELFFRCADLAGHPEVRVLLQTGNQCQDQPGQSVTLTLGIEPAAVDRFVATLERLEQRRDDIAVLEGAA